LKRNSIDKYKELIPEYIAGNLEEAKAAELEETINSSPELKKELDEGLYIKKAFTSLEQSISFDSGKVFSKVLDQIDLEDVRNEQDLAEATLDSFGRFRQWLRDLFASPKVAWSVCVVQTVVVFFALFLFHDSQPRFETMSLANNRANSHEYNVIFRDDARLKDVLVFLEKYHVKIVDGPSQKGVFVIKLKDTKDIDVIKKANFIEFMAPLY